MEIKIVYDNNALKGFQKGWGFSCLIELEKTKILFDTGDGPKFITNLQKFDINPEDIKYVILSHPHHDHIGGLPHLLKVNSELTVYVPSFFPVKLKLQLMSLCPTHETFGYEHVTENMYVDVATNHLYEQFCIIELEQGLLVITGCAHPGLETILLKASRTGKPLFGVIGGFHGFKKLNSLKNLSLIAPCHCTSYKDDILQRFHNSAYPCATGSVFHF